MNKEAEMHSLISQINNLSDQMISIITNLDKCFNSLSFLIGFFQETKLQNAQIDKNSNSSEKIKQLTAVRDTYAKFLPTLKFLHAFIWPEASLLINVREIFDAIYEFMANVKPGDSQSTNQINPINDFKECIELTLRSLTIYYKDLLSKGNQKDLANLQLNQISTISSDLANKEAIEPYSDPLPPLKEWKFDNKPETKIKDINLIGFPLIPVERDDGKFLEIEIASKFPKEKYQQQLILLSTLKHNVLPLVNASFEDDNKKIKCAYQYIDSLFTLKPSEIVPDKVSEYKIQSLNTSSKLIFKIAKALYYLHDRGIVHGNLGLDSIIFQLKDKVFNILLWNFGLFTNEVDKSIIPPELIEEAKSSDYFPTENYLSPETDVYQYGLLLYRFAKDVKEDVNLEEIKKKDFNYDKLKKNCTDAMVKLIKDCLNNDPKKRPSFSQIVTRFRISPIYLNGAVMEPFFLDERFRGLKKDDDADRTFNIILKEVKNYPECKEQTVKGLFKYLDWLFNTEKVTKERRNSLIQTLNRFCFFEKIIQFFDVKDDKIRKKFVESYIKIFQPDIQSDVFGNKIIKHEFLKNGGFKHIFEYIKNENTKELSFMLLDQIVDSFNDECEDSLIKIVPEIVANKRIKYISKLITLEDLSTDCKVRLIKPNINNITPLFKESELSEDVSKIVKFYLQNQNENEVIKDITDINYIYGFKDLMKSGDVPLLRQLMRYQSFLSSISTEDINEAMKAIIADDVDQKQKECALLLCIGLDDKFFEVVSQYNDFIDDVIKNPNQELASRFITRVTMFSAPSEYILSRLEDDDEDDNNSIFKVFVDCQNPWYILSLSRIAGFDSERVSKIKNLKENLIRNIDQLKCVEETLRLLGVLSKEADFWNDLKVAKSLINLLHNNLLTPFERPILLSLLSNLVLIDETKKFLSNASNYFMFLAEAENEGKESGLALRILSRLQIPDQLEREKDILINRLVNIINDQLQNGDKFGIEGSSQLIISMLDHYKEAPENDLVIDNLKNIDIVNLLILASKKEQNINIFMKLMESLYGFEKKSHPELISLFLNMIINNRNNEYDYEKFENLRKLITQ